VKRKRIPRTANRIKRATEEQGGKHSFRRRHSTEDNQEDPAASKREKIGELKVGLKQKGEGREGILEGRSHLQKNCQADSF